MGKGSASHRLESKTKSHLFSLGLFAVALKLRISWKGTGKKNLGLSLKLLFRVMINWVCNHNYFATTIVQQSMYSLIQIITDFVKQFFGLLNLLHFPETKKGKCMLSLLIITSSKDLNSLNSFLFLYECNSCKQILTFNMHDWLHPVYFGFFPVVTLSALIHELGM